MLAERARKHGDSIVLTIPSHLGIEEGDEFFFIRKGNGAITLIPKVDDHFADVKDGEFYLPEEDVSYGSDERELDEL